MLGTVTAMSNLLVILLILTEISTEDKQTIIGRDYCQNFCQNESHIVCERAGRCPITIANCKRLNWDITWRQFLLKKHNRIRDSYARINLVGNMQLLNYDLELEYIAMCFANTCPDGPEPCMTTKRFQIVGQNVFRRDLRDLDGDIDVKWRKHAFHLWYEEGFSAKVVRDSSGNPLIPDLDKYGSFVRMVWPSTTHLGCAKSKNKDNFYIFCNYGPSLEPNSTSFFAPGKPCSSCSEQKCNHKYANLCGVLEDIPEEFFYTSNSSERINDFLGLILVGLVVVTASNLEKILQYRKIACHLQPPSLLITIVFLL